MRYLAWLTLATFLAIAPALMMFTPRYQYWPGAWYPPGAGSFEAHRAVVLNRQIRDPLTPILNPAAQRGDPLSPAGSASNHALRWRLLFPVLGWMLGLSYEVVLALPFLGVLCLCAYTIHATLRVTGDRWVAWLAGALLCTFQWFAASTGFLAFFDAWYLLALLVVTASPRPSIVAVVCLLSPWIDEKFVWGLPLALWLRRFTPAPQLKQAMLAAALGLLPYLPARLWGLTQAEDPARFTGIEHHPSLLLLALWMSLRLGWVPVIPFLVRSPVTPVLALLTIAPWLWLVQDVSRSLCILLPLVWVSLITRPNRRLLAALVIGNLLLPQTHVWDHCTLPIQPVWVQTRQLPPPDLTASVHAEAARQALQAGDFPLTNDEAQAAQALDPDDPEGWRLRGEALLGLGAQPAAQAMFTEALRRAPPEWPYRDLVLQRLDGR